MFQAYNSLLKVSQVICFWREKTKEEVSSAHNNSPFSKAYREGEIIIWSLTKFVSFLTYKQMDSL